MSHGFARTQGEITLTLDRGEAGILAELFDQVAVMLEEGLPDENDDPFVAITGIHTNATVPQDSAVARLLPTGSLDEDAAGEYRRFTDISLRTAKIAALRTAHESVFEAEHSRKWGPLTVGPDLAQSWLVALGDVRLVLADRLGIRSTEDSEAVEELALSDDDHDPRVFMSRAYGFASWLQSDLVDALQG